MGISILMHKWKSMFNFDLIKDTIAISKDIMTYLMAKCAIHLAHVVLNSNLIEYLPYDFIY